MTNRQLLVKEVTNPGGMGQDSLFVGDVLLKCNGAALTGGKQQFDTIISELDSSVAVSATVLRKGRMVDLVLYLDQLKCEFSEEEAVETSSASTIKATSNKDTSSSGSKPTKHQAVTWRDRLQALGSESKDWSDLSGAEKTGTIVVLFILAIAAYSTLNSEPDPASERNSEVSVYTQCERWVKERLKAPSTSEFPWYDSSRVQKIGDGHFVVRGYVDAQNSYGAQIRSNYLCESRFTNGKWVPLRVVIN